MALAVPPNNPIRGLQPLRFAGAVESESQALKREQVQRSGGTSELVPFPYRCELSRAAEFEVREGHGFSRAAKHWASSPEARCSGRERS
jgi:hypothetical protein